MSFIVRYARIRRDSGENFFAELRPGNAVHREYSAGTFHRARIDQRVDHVQAAVDFANLSQQFFAEERERQES